MSTVQGWSIEYGVEAVKLLFGRQYAYYTGWVTIQHGDEEQSFFIPTGSGISPSEIVARADVVGLAQAVDEAFRQYQFNCTLESLRNKHTKGRDKH